MIAALLLAVSCTAPPDSDVLLVRVLDVSDARIGGDAILITDSSAGCARHVLVDASDHGPTVTRWLALYGVDTLAALVLSHAHADHYGGMPDVLAAVPVRAFIYGGTPRTTRSYRELLGEVGTRGIPVVTADSGLRTITVATGRDTFRLELLPPPLECRRLRADAGVDINNCSLGVRLVRGDFAMLLPGDAQAAELQWWLRRYRSRLRAAVLKAGHHGSSNATTSEWLNAVRPRAVVISANGRQHPFASVLRQLGRRAIPVYCTADDGTITIRVPRDGSWKIVPQRVVPCHAGNAR